MGFVSRIQAEMAIVRAIYGLIAGRSRKGELITLHCNIGISCYGRSGLWQEALELFTSMPFMSVPRMGSISIDITLFTLFFDDFR